MTAPVVYLGAVGRSGTTLLERTLASSGGFVALGEVVHLWERGLSADEPCGCGQPFSSCPFWRDVGIRAFGGWERFDLDLFDADRRRVDRNRFVPFLIAPRLAPRSFRAALQRVLDVLERLYRAIEETARERHDGPIVLVDSSKHPSYLFVLRRLRSTQLGVLHVVRDPRGVANSWSRQVERPESGDDMERLGTVRSVARWTSHNLLFELARLLGSPTVTLSYEQFALAPGLLGRRVDALLDHVGIDHARTSVETSDPSVALGEDHTVSGNPMRFATGVVSIRPDDTWRRTMPHWRQLLIGCLTTPLRQIYSRS